MKQKLTPWFPASVKPVRVGVYRRIGGGIAPFSYWNGRWWGSSALNPAGAVEFRFERSLYQGVAWRGLAKP